MIGFGKVLAGWPGRTEYFPFSLTVSERKIEYEILRRGQREKAFEFYVGIVHDFRMGHSNESNNLHHLHGRCHKRLPPNIMLPSKPMIFLLSMLLRSIPFIKPPLISLKDANVERNRSDLQSGCCERSNTRLLFDRDEGNIKRPSHTTNNGTYTPSFGCL